MSPRRWLDRARQAVRQALRAYLTPGHAAIAVGVGLWIGCLPLYGAHLALTVAAARIWRLNLPVMLLSSQISNPLFAPALYGAEWWVGSALLPGVQAQADMSEPFWSGWRDAPEVAIAAMLGSQILGIPMGLLGGGLAWAWWRSRIPPNAIDRGIHPGRAALLSRVPRRVPHTLLVDAPEAGEVASLTRVDGVRPVRPTRRVRPRHLAPGVVGTDLVLVYEDVTDDHLDAVVAEWAARGVAASTLTDAMAADASPGEAPRGS